MWLRLIISFTHWVFSEIINYFARLEQPLPQRLRPNAVQARILSRPAVENELISNINVIQRYKKPLAQKIPGKKVPWYFINEKETITLSTNAIRDFTWALISSLGINSGFQKSDNYWQQTLAQQVWPSIFVLGSAPLTALGAAQFYDKKYKDCLKYAGIASVSALAAIVPWNAMAYLGQKFYEELGYDKDVQGYLAAIFPGPGAAEGPLQTLITTGLYRLFVEDFKFNKVAFGLGLSPLAFMPGDIWLTVYNAFVKAAADHTGIKVLQAGAVMLAVLLMNYIILKTQAAATKCIIKEKNVIKNNLNILKSSGSPLHRQAISTPTRDRNTSSHDDNRYVNPRPSMV